MQNVSRVSNSIELSRPINTLVENRTLFESHGAEFSIYDTYESADLVRLDAQELLYCGMISGRKVLHGSNLNEQSFLPMESFVMSPGQTVAIDFPDAKLNNPTTCIAIGIDRTKVAQVCDQLNSNGIPEGIEDWSQLDLSFLHCLHSSATQNLLNRIAESFMSRDADRDLVLNLGIMELLARLLRHEGKAFLLDSAQKDPEQNSLNAVLRFIEDNFHTAVEVDELCRIACMSRSKLYQAFSNCLNCSPMEYIQLRRLERASELLAQGRKVTDVCYDVGYSNPSHFSRRFQQRFGKTPRKYQTERQ